MWSLSSICRIAIAMTIASMALGPALAQDSAGRRIGRTPRQPDKPGEMTPVPTNPTPIAKPSVTNAPREPRRGTIAGGGETRAVRIKSDGSRESVRLSPTARLFRRGDDDVRESGRGIRARGYVARGTTIATLPSRHERVVVSNLEYYRAGDVFYRPARSGLISRYEVVRPPLGVFLSFIPEVAERLVFGGVTYYCHDDVYYLPTVSSGRRVYQVVDVPLGGYLYELPLQHEVVMVSGQRYFRVGPVYFRTEVRLGRTVYIRVHDVGIQPTALYGSVSYQGRLALPPNNVTSVQLIDLNNRGAVLAEQTIQGGQAPIPFNLVAGMIGDPRYSLALNATISVNGRVIYACDPFRVGRASDRREINLTLSPVAGPQPPAPVFARVTGLLSYRERMGLPADAEVVLRLLDNTADGLVVIGEQQFRLAGRQVPIPFEIQYDPSYVEPLGIYTIDAQILVNGEPWFYNDYNYRVITRGHPDDGVDIQLVAAR